MLANARRVHWMHPELAYTFTVTWNQCPFSCSIFALYLACVLSMWNDSQPVRLADFKKENNELKTQNTILSDPMERIILNSLGKYPWSFWGDQRCGPGALWFVKMAAI